jgi:23S rRNA pseudouridine1911/1915/1917 synthase
MTSKDIHILYEDKSLVAIVKPAGLHCERRRGEGEVTVASWLAERYPEVAKSSERWEDAGLVQRLDQMTSGILIAAHSATVREAFRSMTSKGGIKKEYLALVEGAPPVSFSCEGLIGSPYRRAAKVRVYDRKPAGKHRALPAMTRFDRLKYFEEKDFSLVRVRCQTGRRHQVRAHAAHCGYPLVGDALYGAKTSAGDLIGEERENVGFFLHAARLEFVHPVSGELVDLEAEVPGYWPG